jgi:16S rRNA (adenine1518-N6/adenine1519-N6)-dimethyltransferase
MAALDLESEILFHVPPEAFDPPPRVDSSVIRLLPNPLNREGFNRDDVEKLVSAAFAQRRKTLRNSLSGMVTAEQFAAVEIDPGLRAEALFPEDYLRLAREVGSDHTSHSV